jgi:uncharacterized protein YegL
MVGDPLDKVEDGINTIIKELKTNPYALETVWISIIAFAGLAKTLVPLQELATFYPPKFSIGGGTSLGNGLGQLMFELRKILLKLPRSKKETGNLLFFYLQMEHRPMIRPVLSLNGKKNGEVS